MLKTCCICTKKIKVGFIESLQIFIQDILLNYTYIHADCFNNTDDLFLIISFVLKNSSNIDLKLPLNNYETIALVLIHVFETIDSEIVSITFERNELNYNYFYHYKDFQI